MPASLSYWANAEPAQKPWLFHPVRSSSGSLRRPPSARCRSNEPRRRKVLEKSLFSAVNEQLYEQKPLSFFHEVEGQNSLFFPVHDALV
ncbi:hypothetical protein SAMN05443094_106113 [Domibacillus enclensis]|uniref:Uncharacterized protein n=1 Tax=Domibacillus enclensis TaxID=1017273 RepID=A0A1N6Z677_9BACI|nr:hypothetical protein SAMN05443094_106113 [Domibacillus enclensis]